MEPLKSAPPWRVQFWPLYCGKSVEADLISNRCDWNLELGEFYFCAPAFSYVLRTKKKVCLLCHIVLLQFPSLEALDTCLEACPKVLFHGLAALEFEICIEACVQLCFIL